MATLTATITTGTLEVPAAVTPTYRVALLSGAGGELQVQSFGSPPSVVTFPGIPPGRGYTVIGEQFDAAGTRIGSRVSSAPVDVTGVLVTVIGAISVSVQPG